LKSSRKFGKNKIILVKNKILFIAPLRKDRAPSQRFRFEQYLDFLSENGFDYTFSYLVSEKDDKVFYSKGKAIRKFFLMVKYFFIRLKDVSRSSKYDLVFIQREAFFLGFTYFEKRFAKKTKVIFDFDDSIWLPNVSDANKKFNWLKNPQKTAKIISFSDLVFAGNCYLSDYALNYNKNTRIIPTTIDTREYYKLEKTENPETVCIGWSGSITTIQHFDYAIPFLKRIKKKYGSKVVFKVIGDSTYINEELNIKGLAWNKKDETVILNSFDIGIMPLPNDEWAKGKCGLKGLQYMAMEIPTIMSPVGVNVEIINDGENGFLAENEEEWVDKLSLLIENPELRLKIGTNGRKTVVERYSVESQKNIFLNYINELINSD